MDDLRSRFSSLDEVPMPELWSEIKRRAEVPTTTGAMARLGGRRTVLRGAPLAAPLGRQSGLSLSWMVALAFLLVTTIAAGGLVAGAWRLEDLRPPIIPVVSPSASPSLAITPSPTDRPALLVPGPVAATPECPGADSTVALTDQRWTAGPPGPLSEVRPGAIAASAFERPEASLVVALVDPDTGDMCRLVNFLSWNHSAGSAWSPDGNALAILVNQSLLVWSERGLVRPISGNGVREVAWSVDGSALAVIFGEPDAFAFHPKTVKLAFADGSPARDIAFDCDPCTVGAPVWSPDGLHISFAQYRDFDPEGGFDELLAIVSVADGLGTVLDLGLPRVHPVRWLDDSTVLAWSIETTETGSRWEMLSVPIGDPRAYTVVGVPIDVAPDATLRNVSPDGRLVAPHTDLAEVAIVDLANGSRRVIVQASDLAGFVPGAGVWAPDGRSLVFVADVYTGDDPREEVVALWRVNADGSGLRQLTAERSQELVIQLYGWQPVWP